MRERLVWECSQICNAQQWHMLWEMSGKTTGKMCNSARASDWIAHRRCKLSKASKRMCVIVFVLLRRTQRLPPTGGRGRIFTAVQETAIIDMVIRNNGIKLSDSGKSVGRQHYITSQNEAVVHCPLWEESWTSQATQEPICPGKMTIKYRTGFEQNQTGQRHTTACVKV
jgi:hypothetical protein